MGIIYWDFIILAKLKNLFVKKKMDKISNPKMTVLLEKMIMLLLLIVCQESQMQDLQNQKHLSKVEIQGKENDRRIQMETYMNGIINMVMLRNMIKEENIKAL